jgi:hypothetical protein
MSKKNARPLSKITAEIHRADRQSLVTIGRLLTEAKQQLDHGQWLPYLKDLHWTARTAQLYMSVAALVTKYEAIAHLEAAPSALYALVWVAENHDGAMPSAIERLEKSVEEHASAHEQRQAVYLAVIARRYDKPLTDIALKGIFDAEQRGDLRDPKAFDAAMGRVKAIADANPKTVEELDAIVTKATVTHPSIFVGDEPTEDDDDKERHDEEPSFGDQFVEAVEALKDLAAKPAVSFAGLADAGELDMLGNFLKQVAAATTQKAA